MFNPAYVQEAQQHLLSGSSSKCVLVSQKSILKESELKAEIAFIKCGCHNCRNTIGSLVIEKPGL